MLYKAGARRAVGLALALGLALSLAVGSLGLLGSQHPVRAMSGPLPLSSPQPLINSGLQGCPAWRVLTTQNVGSRENSFNGVTSITTTNAWAVGRYFTSDYSYQTLAEHWTGSSWTVTPTPNPDTYDEFSAVAAVTATNVWAVGSGVDGTTGQYKTLIEHWDGVSWSVVSSPNVTGSGGLLINNLLTGVAVVAANDIWAVGSYGPGTSYALIEHWDGAAWSIVTTPDMPGGRDGLASVAADSATDVWAVGLGGNFFTPLVEHWDGSTWSLVTAPYPSGQAIVEFTSVTAFSATNAWAVGSYDDGSGFSRHPLIEHWNGSAWTVSTLPTQALPYNYLEGVAGQPNALYAVGSADAQQSGPSTGLMLAWNGAAWTAAQAPTAQKYMELTAATAQGNTLLAVGIEAATPTGPASVLAAVHYPISSHPMMGIACMR